ncbi:hypothetical protein LXL04_035234 [Taraxacum kok-saghyz]
MLEGRIWGFRFRFASRVSTDSDSDAWFGGSHSYDFRQKEKHIGIMQVLDVRHMELFLTEEYQKGSCEDCFHGQKLEREFNLRRSNETNRHFDKKLLVARFPETKQFAE